MKLTTKKLIAPISTPIGQSFDEVTLNRRDLEAWASMNGDNLIEYIRGDLLPRMSPGCGPIKERIPPRTCTCLKCRRARGERNEDHS